jgi:hypothetical protein
VLSTRRDHSTLAGRMFVDGVRDDHHEAQTDDDASEYGGNHQHDVTSRTELPRQPGTRPQRSPSPDKKKPREAGQLALKGVRQAV